MSKSELTHLRPVRHQQIRVAQATGPTEAQAPCIDRGSPKENSHWESFNLKLSREFLNGGIFNSSGLFALADGWRVVDKAVMPDSSLGYKPSRAGRVADRGNAGNRSKERFQLCKTPIAGTGQVHYPPQADNPTGIEHRAG